MFKLAATNPTEARRDRPCVVRKEHALNPSAIREFLVTEYPRLVAAVALATDSRPAAEDAVQEALARAWERSARGEHIESLGAWVTRVAIHLARSRWRRALAERRARGRLPEGNLPPELDEEPVDLRAALAALPRRQREAAMLCYYLGHGVRKIAGLLGVTEGTVEATLHRARGALARALRDREGSHVG